MTTKPLNPALKALLEYGPTVGFVLAYLVVRNDTFVVAGTAYSGFIAVTAVFIPVFIIAMGALWLLSGKIARIQVATAVMVLVFGGLGVWLNDPALFKMKPTAIYATLALLLGVGLMRGQSWLKYIMEDMIPLRKRGWMILTRRLTALFVLAAVANELVWRTQSEEFWLLFETLIMPLLVAAFFVTQIGLFIENASWGPSKKPTNRKKRAP